MKPTEERNLLSIKEENLVNQERLKERPAPHQADFPFHFFSQRHIDGLIVVRGDSDDLPDGTTHTQMYYEEDTKKLKIWNTTSEDWDEVQFA